MSDSSFDVEFTYKNSSIVSYQEPIDLNILIQNMESSLSCERQRKWFSFFLNINNDRRMKELEGKIFNLDKKDLSWLKKLLGPFVEKSGVGVLAEVLPSYLETVVGILQELGFETEVIPYNDSLGATFRFVLFSNEKLKFQVCALTKSRNPIKYQEVLGPKESPTDAMKEESYGEMYHKSYVIVDFHGVHIIACHLGLRNETKIAQMSHIYHSTYNFDCWIIMGDMNCFDFNESDPVMLLKMFNFTTKFLPNSTVKWATEHSKALFYAMPYDIINLMPEKERNEAKDILAELKKKEDFQSEDAQGKILKFRRLLDRFYEQKKRTIVLDHVFSRGLTPSVLTALIEEDGTLCSDHPFLLTTISVNEVRLSLQREKEYLEEQIDHNAKYESEWTGPDYEEDEFLKYKCKKLEKNLEDVRKWLE